MRDDRWLGLVHAASALPAIPEARANARRVGVPAEEQDGCVVVPARKGLRGVRGGRGASRGWWGQRRSDR
eukprot:scaffold239256_cov33-Tisochrysis_lutea.AAC.1